MTLHETYEQRWARRDAALQRRIAEIPSRFTNDALYEPAPVTGLISSDAERRFFGTSFTMFDSLVKKAARHVSYQWPGVMSSDDAEQELWLRLVESPGSLAKLRDEFDNKSRLNALIQMGHQIGNKALNEQMIAKGDFRYAVNTVKGILTDAAEQERNPNAKKVTRSALLDLTRGMESLREKNPSYADAISDRYRKQIIPPKGSSAVRLSRALVGLTNEMNRSFKLSHVDRPDGPGTRKAVSNSAAAAISQRQYNGDERFPSPGSGTQWKYKDFSHLKGERL